MGHGKIGDSAIAAEKEILIVCHESYMADGGRPSGDGLQEQSPNRPELHM